MFWSATSLQNATCVSAVVIVAAVQLAWCQQLYNCSGLSTSEILEPNGNVAFPTLDSQCPCQLMEGDQVSAEVPHLLLRFSQLGVDSNAEECLWHENETNSKMAYTRNIVAAKNLNSLISFCNMNGTSANVCVWEAKKTDTKENKGSATSETPYQSTANTKLSIKSEDYSKDPTEGSSTPILEAETVTRPANVTGMCNAADDCSDDHTCNQGHCQHVCKGLPSGDNGECSSAAVHSKEKCLPDKNRPHHFLCFCDPPSLVEEYAANGTLMDCKNPCKSDDDCNWDEICRTLPSQLPSILAISGANGSENSRMNKQTCIHVCHPPTKCKINEKCQLLEPPGKHQSTCICEQGYMPLPENQGCLQPVISSNESNSLMFEFKVTHNSMQDFNELNESSKEPRWFNQVVDQDQSPISRLTIVQGNTVKLFCAFKNAFPPADLVEIVNSQDATFRDSLNIIKEVRPSLPNSEEAQDRNYFKDTLLDITFRVDARIAGAVIGCNASHDALKGGTTQQIFSFEVLECTLDSDCSHNETCDIQEKRYNCTHVCENYQGCNSSLNEMCISHETRPHELTCVCKNGFEKDSAGRCLKKCIYFTNCEKPEEEACVHGLCKNPCEALLPPCDMTTTVCKADAKGSRRCQCLNDSMYSLTETKCQVSVKPSPTQPKIFIGEKQVICEQSHEQAPIRCHMPKAVHGNKTVAMGIIVNRAFPEPKMNLSLNMAQDEVDLSFLDRVLWTSKQQKQHASDKHMTFDYTWKSELSLCLLPHHNKTLMLTLTHPGLDSDLQELRVDILLNISGCSNNDQCSTTQACGNSKEDGLAKCLAVCSTDLQTNWPTCPDNSTCNHDEDEPHHRTCSCFPSHQEYYSTRDPLLQCPLKCQSDGQCGSYEKCSRVDSNNPLETGKACLPICETTSCGSNAICSAVGDQAFQCNCKDGYYMQNGEIAGKINTISSCYQPVYPVQLYPKMIMKLGRLPETEVCEQAAQRCSDFYGADGEWIELSCHLCGVFPKPRLVFWEIVESDKQNGEMAFPSAYLSRSNNHFYPHQTEEYSHCSTSMSSSRPSDYSRESSLLARDYVYDVKFSLRKSLHSGRKIQCKIGKPPHHEFQSRNTSDSFWIAQSSPLNVYECSSPGICGAILHPTTILPAKKVMIGTTFQLDCETDFPLLHNVNQKYCSWMMTRLSTKPSIQVDLYSWENGTFSSQTVGSKQLSVDRVSNPKDLRTDCSIIIQDASLAVDGTWSCSAVLFNQKNTSDGQQSKKMAVPVVVIVPPSSISMSFEADQRVERILPSLKIPEQDITNEGITTDQQVARFYVAGPSVTVTFKCIANDTHPAPTFKWFINSGGHINYIITMGIEIPGGPADGNSKSSSSPQLKTYLSNFERRFHVRNEAGVWALYDTQVTCTVTYQDNGDKSDGRQGGVDHFSKIGKAKLRMVIQEEHTSDTIITIFLGCFSALLLLLIVGAAYNFRKQLWMSPANLAHPTSTSDASATGNMTLSPGRRLNQVEQFALSELGQAAIHVVPPEEENESDVLRSGRVCSSSKHQHRRVVPFKAPDNANGPTLLPKCSTLVLDEIYGNPGQLNNRSGIPSKATARTAQKLPKTHEELIYADLIFVNQEKEKLQGKHGIAKNVESNLGNREMMSGSQQQAEPIYATIVGTLEQSQQI